MPSAVRPFRLWNFRHGALRAGGVFAVNRAGIIAQLGQPRLQIAHVAARRADAEHGITRVVILRGGLPALRAPARRSPPFWASSSAGCRRPILPCALVAGLPRVRRGGRRVLRHRGRRVRRQRLHRAERNRPVADLQRIERRIRLDEAARQAAQHARQHRRQRHFLMFRFTLLPPFRQNRVHLVQRCDFRMQSAKPLSFAAPFRVEPAGVNPRVLRRRDVAGQRIAEHHARRLSVARASSIPFSSISGFWLRRADLLADDHPADIRPQLAFGHAPALHLPDSVGHNHNGGFALQRLTASTAPSSGTLC